MLGQGRRRWTSIKTALGQVVVFDEKRFKSKRAKDINTHYLTDIYNGK